MDPPDRQFAGRAHHQLILFTVKGKNVKRFPSGNS
jgi:hypothetical protein